MPAASPNTEPTHRIYRTAEDEAELVSRSERVSTLQAENAVLRSAIDAIRDAADERTALYTKEVEVNAELRRELTSLHRQHRLFQIQYEATKRELSQLRIEFLGSESQVSQMRGKFNRQAAETREVQNERDVLIAILESKGLADEFTCPACEDRFRAPGDDVCSTCHVEPCGGDK